FVVLLKLAVNPPVTESTIDGLLPRHALGARPFLRELQPDASGGTRLFRKPLFPGGGRGKGVDGEPVFVLSARAGHVSRIPKKPSSPRVTLAWVAFRGYTTSGIPLSARASTMPKWKIRSMYPEIS